MLSLQVEFYRRPLFSLSRSHDYRSILKLAPAPPGLPELRHTVIFGESLSSGMRQDASTTRSTTPGDNRLHSLRSNTEAAPHDEPWVCSDGNNAVAGKTRVARSERQHTPCHREDNSVSDKHTKDTSAGMWQTQLTNCTRIMRSSTVTHNYKLFRVWLLY